MWGEHVGEIAATNLRASRSMAWLRSDYKPRRFDGSSLALSAKTLRNYWVTLSAFFRWASAEFERQETRKSDDDGVRDPDAQRRR